jgi:hypothetical protein
MSRTVGNAAVRTHENGLRARTTRLRTLANSDENRPETRNSGALVREVMRSVGLSQKAFAINAGQPESVISEALNGQRNIATDWIDAQDDTFVVAYAEGLIKSRGLLPTNKRQARMATAMALMQQLVEAIEGDDQ